MMQMIACRWQRFDEEEGNALSQNLAVCKCHFNADTLFDPLVSIKGAYSLMR